MATGGLRSGVDGTDGESSPAELRGDADSSELGRGWAAGLAARACSCDRMACNGSGAWLAAGGGASGGFVRDAVAPVDVEGASLRRRGRPPFQDRGAGGAACSGADTRLLGVGVRVVEGVG